MSDIRDKLEALLSPEDLATECPTPQSALRRPEPARLPVAEAIHLCQRGHVIAASEDGAPVVVAKLASGTISVLADICPHDGGLLSDGYVEGELVVCARHGWEFDGHTGQCRSRTGVTVPCRQQKTPHI